MTPPLTLPHHLRMSIQFSSTPIVAISTKLYFSPSQTLAYVSDLTSLIASTTKPPLTIFVPDFLTIWKCTTSYPTSTSQIHYGAQDGHWEDRGPWTGEISMSGIRDIGGEVVELGHAERKKWFGETDEVLSKKCVAAVRNLRRWKISSK
jgi:triosephosphate isomerase